MIINWCPNRIVADDGTAGGRFLEDDVYFMTARPHGPPPMSSPLLGIGDGRASRVDPRILDDPAGLFAEQLAAPSAVRLGGGEEVALLSAKFWREQIEEQQQRLSETRRVTAVLVETMCEVRDQMRELREQCKRRLVPTRSSSTPRG